MIKAYSGGDAAPETDLQTGVRTDSHAHLSLISQRGGPGALSAVLSAYDAAWEDACAKGHPETAPRILDPGTLANDLPERLRMLGQRPWLRFSAGIWPDKDALENPGLHISALEAAAVMPECAAVGEGGLDYHWMHGTRDAQRKLFEAQLDLAIRIRKPFIVHSRDAHADTVEILAAVRPDVPVIIHCFGYDAPAVREYLDLGCVISFAGNLTYPSASGLREACALVPLERLLLETDSPYMAPVPVRGKACTPLFIHHTYAAAAQLLGIGSAELAKAVTENVRRIFG